MVFTLQETRDGNCVERDRGRKNDAVQKGLRGVVVVGGDGGQIHKKRFGVERTHTPLRYNNKRGKGAPSRLEGESSPIITLLP